MAERRYRLVCVAPEIPGRGSYDDLDEAIANSDAHFEVYDSQTGEWPGAYCKEDYDEAVERLRLKRESSPASTPPDGGRRTDEV